MADRLHLPEGLMREVRKRCGGGCVICGLRIFDYEHREDYSKVKTHDPNNISLLCKKHHDEKTRKRLDLALYDRCILSPYNLRRKNNKAHTVAASNYRGNQTVGLDNYSFSHSAGKTKCLIAEGHFAPLLVIDFSEIILIRRQDELALLTMRVFNKDRVLIFEIIDGEVITNVENLDQVIEGNTVTIRTSPGKIISKFILSGEGLHIERGTFYGPFGSIVDFTKKQVIAVRQGNPTVIDKIKSNNKAIVVLPHYLDICDIMFDGNLNSTGYLSALRNLALSVDRNAYPDEYYYDVGRYLNALSGVARSRQDMNLVKEGIPVLRQFIDFCRETGRDFEYAKGLRALGREIYRAYRNNKLALEESIGLLRQAVGHPILQANLPEFARANANLADSLHQMFQHVSSRELLLDARLHYEKALEFWSAPRFTGQVG